MGLPKKQKEKKKGWNKRRETKLVQGSNTTTLPADNQALYLEPSSMFDELYKVKQVK